MDDLWKRIEDRTVIYLIMGNGFTVTKTVVVQNPSPHILMKDPPANTFAFKVREYRVVAKRSVCIRTTYFIDGRKPTRIILK